MSNKIYKITDLIGSKELLNKKVQEVNTKEIYIVKENTLETECGIDIARLWELHTMFGMGFELVEVVEAKRTKKEEMFIANFYNRVMYLENKHKILEIISKYDFKNEVKVYLASGFMFQDLGQIGLELLADICEAVNLNYYLPQHAAFNDKTTTDFVITNKIIADGDNEELRTCNVVLAHIQSPMDDGVCGEISRFKTMSEYEPDKYWGVIGWTDDIRLATIPNPEQRSFNNQTLYLNQYCVGEIENSLGCYETLDRCIERIWDIYKENTNE